MLLDYLELLDVEKWIAWEVRLLKVPFFVKLLCEDLSKKLIYRGPTQRVSATTYWFGIHNVKVGF